MADFTAVQIKRLEKMTTTIPAERNVRCTAANCFGQTKRLSLLRGLLGRCGLCDARRPFRRLFKCFECKTTFHRRCAVKASCTHEPDEGLHHTPARVRGDGVCGNSYANSDTTTVVTDETKTTNTTDEQTLENAPADICSHGVSEQITANPKTTTTAVATDETNTTDTTDEQTLEDAPADICSHGVSEQITANPEITTTTTVTDETNTTDTTDEQTLEDAPADICSHGVSEQITANPETLMTTAVATDETTTNHCLPPTRRTEISPLDYFTHVFEVISDDEKKRLKESIARAPRPVPVRSSLTRTDYLEMYTTWDEPTFKKYRKRDMFRVVHSKTVWNTTACRPDSNQTVEGVPTTQTNLLVV